MIPIVTAEEMRRLEKLSKETEDNLMECAGKGIAKALQKYLDGRPVYLFVGKGNNGGDALVAGRYLLKQGIQVRGFHLFPWKECSPLCQKNADLFKKAGGKLERFYEGAKFEGIILAALVGTGFTGKAEGLLAEAIHAANQSGSPIVALDAPSGLNCTTGAVETVAIKADRTFTIGLPKIGFFIGKGWDHVGRIEVIDIGLPVKEAKAVAHLFEPPVLLPPMIRSRHKYQAGYVLAVAGSPGMPGAAMLATLSALRTGAGIVRLFHPKGMEPELACAPYELIRECWNPKRFKEEMKRARALLIGPAMGKKSGVLLKQLLSLVNLPSVIDADALYLLAKHPEWKIPKDAILTPHHEEMKRLLGGKAPTLDACQRYADKNKTTLVLKGAPTIIFHPKEIPIISMRGDPGMATAGTGDVLTGVIAGLLAQGLKPREAAVLGAFLHGLSGELCAFEKSSYGLIASDLIEKLPEAIRLQLRARL